MTTDRLFDVVSLIRSAVLAILVACFGLTTSAQADQADQAENGSPVVEYRQTVMSIIGANMGAMGDIMKNGLVLPGHVAVHAGQMAAMAKLIAPAFENNVATEATDSKPKIWQEWSEFEKAIQKFERAAGELQSAADGTDKAALGPAMKALGKSCGGCHKMFRKPKEESFRRMQGDGGHDHSKDHQDDDK